MLENFILIIIYYSIILLNIYNFNKLSVSILIDLFLGIGDWGLGPIPNPQSPIPNKLLIIMIVI